MADLLSEHTPTARKKYPCMAWDFLREAVFDPGELTFAELRAIAQAKAAKGYIVPGQKYLRQAIKDGGEIRTFVAIPALHAICIRFEMYED
jgi:hypothetical protein